MARKSKTRKIISKKSYFIILVAVVLFGLYYYWANLPVSVTKNTGPKNASKYIPRLDKAAQDEFERTPEWGYQLDYPADWYFNSGKSERAVVYVSELSSHDPNAEKVGNSWISFQIQKYEKQPDEQPLDLIERLNQKESQSDAGIRYSPIEKLYLNGKDVYKQMLTPELGRQVYAYYIFGEDNKVVIFSVRPVDSIYLDQVEPIIGSLEFIDSN